MPEINLYLNNLLHLYPLNRTKWMLTKLLEETDYEKTRMWEVMTFVLIIWWCAKQRNWIKMGVAAVTLEGWHRD